MISIFPGSAWKKAYPLSQVRVNPTPIEGGTVEHRLDLYHIGLDARRPFENEKPPGLLRGAYRSRR
jgi:hypothetical protein